MNQLSSPANFPGAAPESVPFANMIDALRMLQQSVAGTGPPDDLAQDIAVKLESIRQMLTPYQVAEDDRIYGKRWDIPGRGQTLVPPLFMHHVDDKIQKGHLTFDASHIGAGCVVHGGVIPLVFVELLGLFANSPGKPLSRMAYLRTDFRGPVRVGKRVTIEATLSRTEGRKVFVEGRISEGDSDLAVAEALFLTPR